MVWLAPQGGSLQTAGSQKFFKGTLETDSYPSKSVLQVPMTGQASPSMQTTNNCFRQVSDGDFQLSAAGSQRKGSTSTQTATVHPSQQSTVGLPTGVWLFLLLISCDDCILLHTVACVVNGWAAIWCLAKNQVGKKLWHPVAQEANTFQFSVSTTKVHITCLIQQCFSQKTLLEGLF